MSIDLRVLLLLSITIAPMLSACDDDGPPPYGYGPQDYGALCYHHEDCATRFCCTSPPCGHGTCSYHCAIDADCPSGMACDAGVCFFTCRVDGECWDGQHCKRDRWVCQY
ncbi:MAG: hypothetical protein QM784_18720 [Polyangiaceae bacterium]